MKYQYISAALRGIIFAIGSESIVWAFVFILICLLHELIVEIEKRNPK